MEDDKIVDLYWERSETAIAETENKYGRYCRKIAYNILHNNEDSEECVNDTYLRAWGAMPTQRPCQLSTYLGKITRNLALDRYEYYTAEKRGKGETILALHELQDCIPSSKYVEKAVDDMELTAILNRFLGTMPIEKRQIFMRRYWYLNSIREISDSYHMTESKVKMMLYRTRKQLKKFLEKEGVDI